MKHFRLRVILSVLLAAGFVVAFSWIVVGQNYSKLSGELSKEKPLTREAVSYTLENLSESWAEYETKITDMYRVEAVFAALALQNVIDEGIVPEEETRENGIVISIRDGELSSSDPAVGALGLEASLFTGKSGTFAAPNEPSTLVAYSRIGNTSGYYVGWYENTIINDIVEESLDLPDILKRTEITYDVPAMFVSCDPDSQEISGILYKNERYFSDCESLEDLGLTRDNLEADGADASGTLRFDDAGFSYVAGKSALPAGYVILLEPVPNLYAKAFGQAGYMIAALIILLVTVLVAGFALYLYVRYNILTPEEEKAYQPARVRSTASFYGISGLIIIAICGMFSYALNGTYDDAARGRELLGMLDDSISMYAERYSRNMQSFQDVYLDFGSHIAEFLDTYPELQDASVLSTLAESMNASSITLYDSNGCETISSGPWIGLELGTDPDSATYDFRRILKGVPAVVHEAETDEVTGLNEMRLGIRIRDASSDDRYGVMLLCVDIPVQTNRDFAPEQSVREILQNLSDDKTTLWIADENTGQILVSGTEELEGENITSQGLGESELRGSLVRLLKTEEGKFLVISRALGTPGILEWTGASEGVIAYCKGPDTTSLSGMFSSVLTGCILFCVIYAILAWIILAGYTDDFFNTYRRAKGDDDPKKKLNPLLRAFTTSSPIRNGVAAMEVTTAVFLIQLIPVTNSESSLVRNSVYHYITSGKWERGFNLFAIAAMVLLLAEIVLFVIFFRIVMALLAAFLGPKGKTIFGLLASVMIYIAFFFFLIKAFEYLGFSLVAIAASMGSLALSISLGAQNFVSDILAGLTFVFEGTVHAGDFVQVSVYGSSGIQGKVVEVGIRCMKILTLEGDLITCSNRDVRVVRNSTLMNSRIICKFVVSSDIPADDLKQMLEAELPEIGRADRRILRGPAYNGISEISNGRMTISVSAECSEEDYHYVKDKLNTSLQRIFRDHGYRI